MTVEYIVELMAANPNDLKLIAEGVNVFKDQYINKDSVVAAGGHLHLLKAITTHLNATELLIASCEALENIADSPGGPRSEAIIEAGAGPVLVMVTQTYSDAKNSAIKVLEKLGLRDDGKLKVRLLLIKGRIIPFNW